MHDNDVYQIRSEHESQQDCYGLDQLLEAAQSSWDSGVKRLRVARICDAPELLVVPKQSYKMLPGYAGVESGKVYAAVYARNQPDWQAMLKLFVNTDGGTLLLEADDYDIVAVINNI